MLVALTNLPGLGWRRAGCLVGSLCTQPWAWILLPRTVLSSPCPLRHLSQSVLEALQTPPGSQMSFLRRFRISQGLPSWTCGEFTPCLTHSFRHLLRCCVQPRTLSPSPP